MLDKIAKYLFVLSGGLMFMLLGATALIYKDEILKMRMQPAEADTLQKVRVLGTVQSEGSVVKGDDFFSADELKELVKDTAKVKIETKTVH
jgi:hypothetical protein